MVLDTLVEYTKHGTGNGGMWSYFLRSEEPEKRNKIKTNVEYSFVFIYTWACS
jgi:hypothetical protein